MSKSDNVGVLTDALKSFNWKKLFFRWEVALIVILILEIVIFGSLNHRFLRVPVLLGSINDYISICIIALFGTIVMITGGIDISGGAIIGLTSMVLGLLWQDAGLNIWAAVGLCLFTGVLCGALNGFLVSYVGVQAMVVTLGGLFLYSGLAVVLSTMSASSAYEGISGFPEEFIRVAGGKVFGIIPNPFIIFLILAVIAYILLHKSRYGRYVFLVGVNPNAAAFSGINYKLVSMFTYVLSGLAASIAGVVLTSYLGSCRADLGNEMTMPIVTAVVLGGTAITGGKGSIVGTALAAVVIGLLRFGLQMTGVSTQYDAIICNDSTALPGQAQAAENLGMAGKVIITGFCTPNGMRDFCKNGTVPVFGLWDCQVQGAMGAYLAYWLAAGNTFKVGDKIDIPTIGEVEVLPNTVLDPNAYTAEDSGVVLLPERTIFTKDNIDDYNF